MKHPSAGGCFFMQTSSYFHSMNSSAADILRKYAAEYHPVVLFDPAKDKLLPLDLTANNTAFTEEIYNDIGSFSHYMTEQLKTANAKYAIGGYDEHRQVYSSSAVFDAVGDSEPRRLHLGIDIWGKPYTAVMSPMDGIVHSVAFNNRQGDYGATIILTHRLKEMSFYTLYGHLSLNSIKDKQEGQRIERGEIFAEFGISVENGHWPPHLHFQVILDMGDWQGDYPGVCKLSEREKYLENCPDPDLLLKMNKHILTNQACSEHNNKQDQSR
ncbi:MAG TPA: peptidoglycan DD-metalloendopeptidase family protein [Chitinophagaceae bacterium]